MLENGVHKVPKVLQERRDRREAADCRDPRESRHVSIGIGWKWSAVTGFAWHTGRYRSPRDQWTGW